MPVYQTSPGNASTTVMPGAMPKNSIVSLDAAAESAPRIFRQRREHTIELLRSASRRQPHSTQALSPRSKARALVSSTQTMPTQSDRSVVDFSSGFLSRCLGVRSSVRGVRGVPATP